MWIWLNYFMPMFTMKLQKCVLMKFIHLSLQHFLFCPDRHLGGGLHHGRALHLPPALPRQLRDRRDLQDLLSAGHPRQEGLAWGFVLFLFLTLTSILFKVKSKFSHFSGHKLAASMNFKFPQFSATPLASIIPQVVNVSRLFWRRIFLWQPATRRARRRWAWWRTCWGGTQRSGQVQKKPFVIPTSRCILQATM